MTESHSPGRLDGKVALITGSSRGIGAAIASELASRGASVVLNSRTLDAASATAATIESSTGSDAIAVAGDMTKLADIRHLFEAAKARFGRLDIVVSNSGVEHFGAIAAVSEEAFDRVFSRHPNNK